MKKLFSFGGAISIHKPKLVYKSEGSKQGGESMRGHKITQAQKDEIIDLCRKGTSQRTVAKLTGVPEGSIFSWHRWEREREELEGKNLDARLRGEEPKIPLNVSDEKDPFKETLKLANDAAQLRIIERIGRGTQIPSDIEQRLKATVEVLELPAFNSAWVPDVQLKWLDVFIELARLKVPKI